MVKLSVSELSDIVIGTPSIYTIFIDFYIITSKLYEKRHTNATSKPYIRILLIIECSLSIRHFRPSSTFVFAYDKFIKNSIDTIKLGTSGSGQWVHIIAVHIM